MAQDPVQHLDELTLRRRERDRERQRRNRERRRHTPVNGTPLALAPAPEPRPPAAPPSSSSSSSSSPLHGTRRLESIGSTPEAYSRVPPHVDAPAAAAAPPSADQVAGATKVAVIVAGMFRLALQDATTRYQLGELLVANGIPLAQANSAMEGAVGHVFGCTQRAALKHGIGITLPYEDEITAVGAAGLSAAYLFAKFTGRLDAFDEQRRRAAEEPHRVARKEQAKRPTEPEPFDAYTPISMEAA